MAGKFLALVAFLAIANHRSYATENSDENRVIDRLFSEEKESLGKSYGEQKRLDSLAGFGLGTQKRLDSLAGFGLGQQKRLDSLAGFGLGHQKRFDTLRGFGLGSEKRSSSDSSWRNRLLERMQNKRFDPIEYAGFGSFVRKRFDPIEQAGFGSFVKKFDPIEQAGFGSFVKRKRDAE